MQNWFVEPSPYRLSSRYLLGVLVSLCSFLNIFTIFYSKWISQHFFDSHPCVSTTSTVVRPLFQFLPLLIKEPRKRFKGAKGGVSLSFIGSLCVNVDLEGFMTLSKTMNTPRPSLHIGLLPRREIKMDLTGLSGRKGNTFLGQFYKVKSKAF